MGGVMTQGGFGFQPAGASGGSGGSNVVANDISCPALTAGVSEYVAHGLTGCTKFFFSAFYNNNTVECTVLQKDPSNPTSKFEIQVPLNFGAGDVIVKAFGY